MSDTLCSCCPHCDEPITAVDRTETVPHVVMVDGRLYSRDRTLHEECAVRRVVGPASHLARQCSCFVPGGGKHDPDGMSRRQAARLARAMVLYYKLAGWLEWRNGLGFGSEENDAGVPPGAPGGGGGGDAR